MRQHAVRSVGWTLALALVLALGGCQRAPEPKRAPEAAERAVPSGGLGAPGAPARDAAPAPEARRIIRRAEVALVVPAVPRAVERVRSLVKAQGGYVADESLETRSGAIPTGTMTLRVPVATFDALLRAFGSLGEVQSRRVTAEDVTLEVVDTESRLRNLRREEEQFLAVLRRAGSIRDVLAVERELARVRGEIEQTTGRLRQLNNLVDLATVTVTLTARAQEGVSSPWDLAPVLRNAWQDAQARLAATTARILSGLVWVGAYLLPIVVPSVLVYLLFGWILGRLLVGRIGWLTRDRFRLAWILLGAGVLVLAFPALLVLALALAVLALAASKVPALRRRWWQPPEKD